MKEFETVKEFQQPNFQQHQQKTLNSDLITDQQYPYQQNFESSTKLTKTQNNMQENKEYDNTNDAKQQIKQLEQKKIVINSLKARAFKRDPNVHSQQNLTIETATIGSRTGTASSQQSQIQYQQFIHTQRNSTKNNILLKDNLNYRQSMDVNGFESTLKNDFQDLKKINQKREMKMMGKTNTNNFHKYLNKNIRFQNFDQKTSYDYGWNNIIKSDRAKSRATKNESIRIPSLPLKKLNQFESSLAIIQQKKEQGIQSWYSKRLNQEKENQSQLNKNFIKSKLSKSKDKESTIPFKRTQSSVKNKFLTVEDEKQLEKHEEEKSYVITYKLKAQQKVRMTQITDLKIEEKNDNKRTILSASNKRNIALNLPESFAQNLMKQSPNKSNVSPQKDFQQTALQIPQYSTQNQQLSQMLQIKNDYQTLQNLQKQNQNLDKQSTQQRIQTSKNYPINRLMNKRDFLIQQQNQQNLNEQNKLKTNTLSHENNNYKSSKHINIISQEQNILKTPKQYGKSIQKNLQKQNISSIKKLQPINSNVMINVAKNQSPHKNPQVKLMTSPQYQITAMKKDTKQIMEENDKLRDNIEKYDMLDYHTNQNIIKLKKKMELAKSDQIEQYRDLATYEYVYCQHSNIGQNIKQILKYYYETNKTLKMNVKVESDGNAYFTNEEIIQSSFFHDSSDDQVEVQKLNQIQKHIKTILKKIIKLKQSQAQPQHIFSNKLLQQYVEFAKSVGLKKNMMKSFDSLRHFQKKSVQCAHDPKKWLEQASVDAFGQTKKQILQSKMNNNVMKEAMKTINSDGDIMKLVNISGILCFLSARSINIEIIGIVSKMISSKKLTFEIRNENFKKQQINLQNEVTKLQFTNKKIKNIDRQIIQSKTQFEEKSKTSNFIIKIKGSYKKYVEVQIQLGLQSKMKNEFLISFQTKDHDKKIYESIDIFEIQKFFQKKYQLKFQNINYEHVAQYAQDQMIFFQRPNGDIQLLDYETSKKLYIKDVETALKQKLDSRFSIYLKSISKKKFFEKQFKISILQKMQSRTNARNVSGVNESSMRTEQQDQSKKNFGKTFQSVEQKSENSQIQIIDLFQNKSQLSRYKFASQLRQYKVISKNNSLNYDPDILQIDRYKNQSFLKGNKFEDTQKLFENDVNNFQKLNKRSKSLDFKMQLSQIQQEEDQNKSQSKQEKENYIFDMKKQYLKLKYQKKMIYKEDLMIDQYEIFYGYRLVKSQNKFKKYKEQNEKAIEIFNQKEDERKEIVDDYYTEKLIKYNFKTRASEHLIQNKRRKYFRETKVFQNDYIQQIEQNGNLRHFQAELDEKDNEYAILYLFCQEKHENFLLLGRGLAKEFLYIEEQSQLQSESVDSQQNIGLLGAQPNKKKQEFLGNLKAQIVKMQTKVIKDEGNEQLNEIIKLNSEIENNNQKNVKRNLSSIKLQEQEKINLANNEEMKSQSFDEIESPKEKVSNINEKEDIVLMQSENNDNDVDNDSPYRVKITVDIKFLSFLQDPLITCGEELPGNYKNIIANENFQELIRLEVEKMFGSGEQKQDDEGKKQGDVKNQNQSNTEVDKSLNELKLKTFDDQKSSLLKVQNNENKSRQDERSLLEKNKNETNQKIQEDDIEIALRSFVPDFSFFLTNDY